MTDNRDSFNPLHGGRLSNVQQKKINPSIQKSVKEGQVSISRAINQEMTVSKRCTAGGRSKTLPKARTMPLKHLKTVMAPTGIFKPTLSELSQISKAPVANFMGNVCSQTSSVSKPLNQAIRFSSTSKRTKSSTTLRVNGGGNFASRSSRALKTQAEGHPFNRVSRNSQISRARIVKTKLIKRPHNNSIASMEVFPNSVSRTSTRRSLASASSHVSRVTPSLKEVADSIRKQLAQSVKTSKSLAAKATELSKRISALK
ncbi:uncharacterized protein [Drosophila virilis]|uniref:Uncharacterized protein n=1 Tax=Drosophila virilis TaxID=7244 RepID=B4LSP8_DROVI|nr:uncharacterized protein LOC6627710 [Drosophila virilis]XP_032294192.1 uncharacterized protein LOC6627710 [Drosophila virilis]EDW63787.1 uncharacterized protein Dvir_GJ16604 [Drosophila virilis]